MIVSMEEHIVTPRESIEPDTSTLKFPPPTPTRSSSFGRHRHMHPHHQSHNQAWAGEYGIATGDRRFAFSRQASFSQSDPLSPIPAAQRSHSFRLSSLSRSDSSISIPQGAGDVNGYGKGHRSSSKIGDSDGERRLTPLYLLMLVVQAIRSGNRPMKRLALMISLNVAYSTTELLIGLFTGRIGLVSDAFHLTFGCGILTFSLLAMAASRHKPDEVYTYGYKRLEVMSAFTNALFLLFLSFSLAVEALHAFIQDESEHKHYLIVSAVANLLVNLLGVWFFRSYARINIVYHKAEDMNYHSVCLHVLADSIRSAGLVLASWFLTLGVENAEVLCLGLVSVAIFMVVLPLFKATASILLQTAPASIPPSALSKCWRQINSLEDVHEICEARFWELVPGHAIGSLSIQVKRGADDYSILEYAHGLYHDVGVQNLTVQAEYL